MTATVKASHFVRILNDVLPFASRDDLVPMISGVLLEAADGVMSATATDRYTLGHARTPAGGQLTGQVFLRLSDAAMLTRLFKPNRRDGDPTIRITIDPGVPLRVARFAHDEDEELGTAAALGVGVRLPDVEFPDYVSIMRKSTRDVKPSGINQAIGLNLNLVAKFAKVAGDGTPARVYTFGPSKPIAVEIGGGFTGMVMPVRLPENSERNPYPERLAPVVPIGHSQPEPAAPAAEAA